MFILRSKQLQELQKFTVQRLRTACPKLREPVKPKSYASMRQQQQHNDKHLVLFWLSAFILGGCSEALRRYKDLGGSGAHGTDLALPFAVPSRGAFWA